MKIEIEKNLSEKFGFDFEKNIKIITEKVPDDHIAYLHKIQVMYLSSENKNKNAYGFYYGEREGEKFPKIVICAKNLFATFPKIALRFSILPRIFLARTIYHEIGHHYQRIHHGVKKAKWEQDAKLYSVRMMKKTFGLQLLILRMSFFPFLFLRKRKIEK